MNKKYFSGVHKKKIGIILIAVVVVVALIMAWGSRQPKAQAPEVEQALEQSGKFQPGMVYYFGTECTRCKNIDKFIAENKIGSKISFVQKEVWHDGSNDMEMRERARECRLDPEKVGVPFLWVEGICYMGEVEVEKFLKNQAQ